MDETFWKDSPMAVATYSDALSPKTATTLRVSYLPGVDWYAFVFPTYHPAAVAAIRHLPVSERYFYQRVENTFKRFSAWCVSAATFPEVLAQLQAIDELGLEFVLPAQQSDKLPPAFVDLPAAV